MVAQEDRKKGKMSNIKIHYLDKGEGKIRGFLGRIGGRSVNHCKKSLDNGFIPYPLR